MTRRAASKPGSTERMKRAVDALAKAAEAARETFEPSRDLSAFERTLREVEALLFAADAPVSTEALRKRLGPQADVGAALAKLECDYARRGVVLMRVAGGWRFQTSPDLAGLFTAAAPPPKPLSQAALETLAVIAYHQPATRADVEAVRGVAASKGVFDVLLAAGWIKPRGRRRSPGRPVTYVTTQAFLEHVGLDDLADLPGRAELQGAGLLDARLPPGFETPDPVAALAQAEAEEDAEADAAFHLDFLHGDEPEA